ncbi:type III pantothenate kinase [Marinimicrobium agarilyticum]|uniref:type III pantothenate kinase n=1 Tax=Marinimicrobium agarilyticum TaxID=306546 RepID=UPI000417688E|nr:type III pantothenate kinase [Marinimicrobium agarilyticum]
MILEIDWGNTRFKWRLRNESVTLAAGAVDASDRAVIQSALIRCTRPAALFVASVRPSEDEQWLKDWTLKTWQLVPCFALAKPQQGGVRCGYSDPASLGPDRWVALLAAWHKMARPLILVQAGTALTVDLVDGAGQHLGGYIGPGWRLMHRSLSRDTARVRVATEPFPASGVLPGRSTASAVSSALEAMGLGLIRTAREQLVDQSPAIVLAGGDAERFHPHFPEATLWPDIVLDGLSLACAETGGGSAQQGQ